MQNLKFCKFIFKIPKMSYLPPCKFYHYGHCWHKNEMDCRFPHVCRYYYYRHGRCDYGDSCRYVHASRDDIRALYTKEQGRRGLKRAVFAHNNGRDLLTGRHWSEIVKEKPHVDHIVEKQMFRHSWYSVQHLAYDEVDKKSVRWMINRVSPFFQK